MDVFDMGYCLRYLRIENGDKNATIQRVNTPISDQVIVCVHSS